MSFVRLNIKSRIELETRVLAAALKLSFERGDSDGAGLAHKQLFYLLKDVGKSEPGNIQSIRISDGVPLVFLRPRSRHRLESVKLCPHPRFLRQCP